MEQIYTQAAVYLTGERRSIYLSCGTDLTAEHLPAGYSPHHHQPRSRIQDQGSKIKDPRSRIQDQGSKIKDLDPRTRIKIKWMQCRFTSWAWLISPRSSSFICPWNIVLKHSAILNLWTHERGQILRVGQITCLGGQISRDISQIPRNRSQIPRDRGQIPHVGGQITCLGQIKF